MTIKTILSQRWVEAIAPDVTHLGAAAEAIRDDALAEAREKLGPAQRQADLAEVLRQPEFINHFVYGLTTRVAATLAAYDPRVRAVYTYDLSNNPADDVSEEERLDTTVHLLVLVTEPSAAQRAFVASLDRALAASLRDLPAPLFAQRESILDVNTITEKDVRLGLGLAGMLGAVFAPPIKIW